MQDQKVEILDTDVLYPKLTVTSTRITIKFPVGYKNKEKIREAFLKIAEHIGKPEFSLRGRLGKEGQFFQMKNNKDEIVSSFDLENLGF